MCRHAVSRREFFREIAIGLPGVSILGFAARRAAWAQAASPGAATDLFDIQGIADGVYFAFARPQAVGNCNAAIFVNAADVLVVDSHSKPSAAAALIAQIRKQVTAKPVRYLVDTHFHWDHAQGNAGYRKEFGKDLKIISSAKTKQLEAEFLKARLRESLDPHGHPFPSQAAHSRPAGRCAPATGGGRFRGAEGEPSGAHSPAGSLSAGDAGFSTGLSRRHLRQDARDSR
jgi:hypothetical protein